MRDRLEKLAIMPFSISSCSTPSSIAIKDAGAKKQGSRPSASSKAKKSQVKCASEKTSLDAKKSLSKAAAEQPARSAAIESSAFIISKSQISNTLQRLIKGFRALSQLFVYRVEEAEEEKELQIGFPTDVKHVAHIGWDGSSGTMKSWMDGEKTGSERGRPSACGEPRSSSWVEDPSALSAFAANDVLGSLGLRPNNVSASQFELFKAANANSKPIPPSTVRKAK
eukprot:TRINITY_DN16695_c0_g1_i1.p1 TRINITY_DN16695_c0_g1~~TRINITY_DN16695_c0_g1_i1.p1  ORF type:complete len:225 (-),score=25.50 TRINITY_DN16695_c0_g1_i1:175-849(-)